MILSSPDCPHTPATTTWRWSTTPRSIRWTPSPTPTSTRKPSWSPTTRSCPLMERRGRTLVPTRDQPMLKLPPNLSSSKDYKIYPPVTLCVNPLWSVLEHDNRLIIITLYLYYTADSLHNLYSHIEIEMLFIIYSWWLTSSVNIL